MTDVLVRLPDQFRRSRDTPTAATPTCCCCCCCFSTVITSSIVLPMRVELSARQSPTVPQARVSTSKAVAAIAPVAALMLAIAAAVVAQSFVLFVVALVAVMAAMLASAFAPFGPPARSLPFAGLFTVAFAVEFVVGFVGIGTTAGIGYVALAVLAGMGVYRSQERRLSAGPSTPHRVESSPPPPLPRPPSSGEPL